MKNNNIISFILTNSLCLLFLGSFLASCEKQSFHSKGHFSMMADRTISRFPASSTKSFTEFQDPKQIYLYCKASDLNIKSCYEFHLSQKAQTYVKKHNTTNVAAIIKRYNFELIEKQIKKINKSLVKIFKPRIDSIVDKRKEYCSETGIRNKSRCQRQFINKESAAISNSFVKSSSLHGYEYLHLNDIINKELKRKLI